MSIETIVSQANNFASSAYDKVNNLVDNIYKAIVEPEKKEGIEGWVFDIPQSEAVAHSKDITDHWTEDGRWVNDHAAFKPATITLSGVVGELVDYYKKNTVLGKVAGRVGAISNRLTALGGTLGLLEADMTPSQRQEAHKVLRDIENKTRLADQLQKRGENIMNFVNSVTQQSRQIDVYNKLYALYLSNELVSVNTPWGEFKNMAITEISFSSEEDSEHISNITISLKELRIAEVKVTNFKNNLFAPRTEMQNAESVNHGMIEGKRVSFAKLGSRIIIN
jgi:hypothetical protein